MHLLKKNLINMDALQDYVPFVADSFVDFVALSPHNYKFERMKLIALLISKKFIPITTLDINDSRLSIPEIIYHLVVYGQYSNANSLLRHIPLDRKLEALSTMSKHDAPVTKFCKVITNLKTKHLLKVLQTKSISPKYKVCVMKLYLSRPKKCRIGTNMLSQLPNNILRNIFVKSGSLGPVSMTSSHFRTIVNNMSKNNVINAIAANPNNLKNT